MHVTYTDCWKYQWVWNEDLCTSHHEVWHVIYVIFIQQWHYHIIVCLQQFGVAQLSTHCTAWSMFVIPDACSVLHAEFLWTMSPDGYFLLLLLDGCPAKRTKHGATAEYFMTDARFITCCAPNSWTSVTYTVLHLHKKSQIMWIYNQHIHSVPHAN